MTDPLNAPGTLLQGRYRLGEILGRGGMSTVYRGVDTSLGRTVAVKVLSPLEADPSTVERARSEIRVLASLNHRSLVTLHDASTAEIGGVESTFLVMEFVDGPSLLQRLREGPLDSDDAWLLLRELAEALHVIHDRGIVHRDMKPGNILLARPALPDRAFDAKLADFGIATLTSRASALTEVGTVVGTAAYLSPEQAMGQRATPASDVYALGLVLLEALTGAHPFPGTLAETLAARLRVAPEVPGALGYRWKSFLTSMTAITPGDRPTAAELLQRLDGVEEEEATAALPVIGAAALASAGVAEAPTERLAAESTAADDDRLDPTLRFDALESLAATRVLTPPTSPPTSPPTRPPRRRRAVLFAAGAAVLAGIVLLIGSALGFGHSGSQSVPGPSTTPHTVATHTPAPISSPTVAPVATPATTPVTTPVATSGSSAGNSKGSGSSKGNGNGKSHGKGKH